jgi:WD40 repeat protein
MSLNRSNPVTRLALACLLTSLCSPARSADRILSKPERIWPAKAGLGDGFEWLPDNNSLISAARVLGPGGSGASFKGAIRVWDSNGGKELRRITSHVVEARNSAVSRDGSKIALVGFGDVLQVWDIKEERAVQLNLREDFDAPAKFSPVYHAGEIPGSLALAPDGNNVALGANDGIGLLDPSSKQLEMIPKSKKTTTSVWAIGFSHDGKTLFARHGDVIDIWEWPTKKLTRTIVLPVKKASGAIPAAISPDGKLVATADADSASRTFSVWDTTTGKLHSRSKGKHKYGIWTMAFAPSGVLVTQSGGDIKLWNVHKGDPLATIPPTNKRTEQADFAISPNGKRLATLDTQIMRIWDISKFTDSDSSSSNSASAESDTKKQDKKSEKPKSDQRSKQG